MNTPFPPLVLAIWIALATPSSGFMLPEDKIGKEFWATLDTKTKPVFLMGYRHGVGLRTRAPETKSGFLVLSAEHFPKLIERLDAFYAIKDNENVCLRLAIQICLMRMAGKPQTEIDELTKVARSLVYTSY